AVEAALRLMAKRGAVVIRLKSALFADCSALGIPLVRSEAIGFHKRWFPARRAEYGADVAKSLDAAMQISAQDYLAALDGRRALARKAGALFDEVDLLAGPTVPIGAFPNSVAYEPIGPGGELPRFALTRLTYPFSLSRLPAITLPRGLTKE